MNQDRPTPESPEAANGAHQNLGERLTTTFGAETCLTEPADCIAYGIDNSRRSECPAAVVFVDTEEQLAALVRIVREHPGTSLTARGRGTGTTGAGVVAAGGVVASFERMQAIVDVDPANRWIVAQPGATNQAVQRAAAEEGFFWPPDPTSSAFCTLGGNLAHNSAGPHAVKYGTPRENTLGLRAVTGAGQPLRTGFSTTKGVVGYDLTRLLIGSEGSLALITEATLKLTPLPEARTLLLARFASVVAAAEAVVRIMRQPVTPAALEFMDHQAVRLMRERGGVDLPANVQALLMIEADGTHATLDATRRALAAAARGGQTRESGCIDVLEAETEAERQSIWAVRKALSPTLRTIAPKKINEDVVVPVGRIAELVARLDELAQRHRILIVNFGHAGNGNLHVNLLVDPDDADEMRRAEACLADVFSSVLDMQGSLSGEHGVGLAKQPYVGREIHPEAARLMHAIKRQFDPDGILNPGKTLPDPI